MLIFKIQNYTQAVMRVINIMFIVLGYFIVSKMSKRKMLRKFIPRKYMHNGTVMSAHERLRILIENLGPTYIKFGQILADRPDLIPENIREELKRLQTTVQPFDHEIAFQLIEK